MDGTEQLLVAHILINNWLKFNLRNTIVLQILAFVSENERVNILKRQAEGIAAAKARGKHLGRPRIEIPNEFPVLYDQWNNGKITAVEFMEIVNMTKGTFYRKVKEFEESLG